MATKRRSKLSQPSTLVAKRTLIQVPRRFYIGAALGLSLWIGLIVASGAGWNPFGVPWNFSNPGAFGDSFGPLSALMASIAAVSAIAAYQSQRSETKRLQELQSREEARREGERSRLLEREAELDRRAYVAAFEGTFFNLLQAFRQIVSEIDVKGSSGPRSAQDAFQSMMSTLGYNESVHGELKEAWRVTSEHFANDLNHYFRFLYHVILYVDQSRVHDKYLYVRLVRAMLSDSELVFLALNCEYGEGREKFKDLVERYSLLHNVSPTARRRWKLDKAFSTTAFEHKISTTPS